MGLFSRPTALSPDLRDREYVLTRCSVVAADDVVVTVDLTLRITLRLDEKAPVGYSTAEEPVLHAIVVLLLRQHAATRASSDLLVDRAGVVDAVEQNLRIAPVGAFTEQRVSAVEVRPHDGDSRASTHEFLLVGG
ncbi:hypothetical protein G7072_05650 [Nocardioides sp. HDW12B]|uniref:hypothetical protein n=1 Tax=Nocardioides sp. HDW12B TaxID=2714939 RepID=UPI0014093F3C|nr:hypothetical protein [Nocardioides sp. HDW12B]QIK65887.1 hypothetical protein G7072_05650 [Nocardioides sp. HDW12B]